MLDALAALLKAVSYAGLLACAGSVFAQRLLPLPTHLHVYVAKLLRRSACVLLLATLGGVAVLQQRLGGEFDAATFNAIFSSSSGAALFMQIVGVILVLALGDDPNARGTRLASAALLTLSFALSGHSAAMGPFQGLIAAIHVSAAAWWIGSLFLLRRSCSEGTSDTAALLRTFSLRATLLIGILLGSGVLLVIILADLKEFPVLDDYERNLAVKLLLVAIVLGLATYNRWRLTPGVLRGEAAATTTLRRLIDGELAVIALVLIATAILTTYTSPHA